MLLWLMFSVVFGRAIAHAEVNVIFIVADDQRSDSIGALGASISTPNIDRLIDAGFAFPNIYNMGSNSPAVCAPSRAMFLTGRNLSAAWNTQSIDGVASIPSTFKAASYNSFGTGKWHQGQTSFAQGFTEGDDIHFGGCIGCSSTSHHLNPGAKNLSFTASLSRLANGSVTGGILENGIHVTERFGNAAVNFIAQQDSGAPYFAYVAFTAPHDPRSSPPAFEAQYRDPAGVSTVALPANFSTTTPANRSAYDGSIRDEILLSSIGGHTQANVKEELADYYGMMTHMDVQIGNIIDEAIRAEGLNPAIHGISDLTNTLFVYTSDHGLAIGSHGLMGKQNPFEHSIRAAPLTFAGSVGGIAIPHGSSNAFAYLTDIFPTLTDLAGLTTPPTVQGVSLGDIIRGTASSVRSSIYNAYRGLSRAIREGDWKLVYYPGLHKAQLFDLASDPHELSDLSADPMQWSRMETMRSSLTQLESQLNAPGSGLVPAQFFDGVQVSWQPALSSTGTGDLSSGDVVLALNGGGTPVLAGGIQFAASSVGSTATGALDGRSTSDVQYDQLLDSMTFGGGLSTSVVLTGLIPGRTYRLQVWYTDLRASSDGRVMSYTGSGRVAVAGEANSAGPQSANLIGNVPGNDPPTFYGQYGVGTFVAVAASETLQLTANGFSNAHYNALLVQDLTVDTGTEHCSGNGGNQAGCTDCPCMNNAAPGTIGGCLNSAATSSRLIGAGSPSVSLPAGSSSDLRFSATGLPPLAFALLNSGNGLAPTSPANVCFSLNSGVQSVQFDGLRCAVESTRRHGGRSADSNGNVGPTNPPWGGEGGPPVGIAQAGAGFVAGQTRYYQIINRDDPLLSCMRGLSTSQAVEVTFTP